MRDPATHLDDNTVVDLLARSIPPEDTRAVAVHLVTCRRCRQMVETCRDLGPDGLEPPLVRGPTRARGQPD